MRHLLTIITIALLTISAQANNFPYRQLTPIPTPHSEELHCLYFDRQGMMWIGTNVGLKSYDGYTMLTIKTGLYSPEIFPSNDILCITQDNNDNLFLGTRNGLVKMHMTDGRTTSYQGLRTIYTLYTAKDGTVWIGTDEGLSRYLPDEDRILTYDHTNTVTITTDGKKSTTDKYSVKSITEDPKGNLFIGTWSHGLLRLSPDRKTYYRYPDFNPKGSAYSLCLDSKGRLWVGTWGYGLLRLDSPYDNHDPKVLPIPYSPNAFNTYYQIVEDPISHTLWASSREGIAIIDRDSAIPQLKTYTTAGNSSLSFANHVTSDSNGNLWVGTANNGIFQFNTHPSPFPQFQLSDDLFTTAIHSVSGLYTPDGRYVWMCVLPFGLACHDTQTASTHVNRQIKGMEHLSDTIMKANFTCFERRYNGELWMGNWSGIVIRTPDTQCRVIDVHNVDYLSENCITSLRQARNHVMWIGQRSGISVVYPNNKGYLLRPHEGNASLDGCDVRGIMEDKKGNIWLATDNNGILRVSNIDNTPSHFKYKQYAPHHKNYLVNDATNLLQDQAGRIWAISNSGGLFLYDEKQDRFDPKSQDYRLDNERILAINEDNDGNLWFTDDRKLTKLTLTNGQPQVTSYGNDDGLQNIFFTVNATTKHDDRLFFNTQKGYFIVNTKQVTATTHRPLNLTITNIYVDNTPISDIDSTARHKITRVNPRYTREITIPHGIRKLEVEFALLTYANTKQNKYAYKLEGYHDQWQYVNSDIRRATFQNLPPDSYQLRVKAIDNNGKWEELPYAITIKVLPPWYATWWAYFLYVVLILAFVLLAMKWYKNYLKTKNKLQMQVIFTNITHELLTPLTVMLAIIDDLRQKAPSHESNYQIMQNSIRRVTLLLREILEVRKAQAGQLKLLVTEGDLAHFLRNITDNLKPMTHLHHVNLTTHIPDGEIRGWFDTDKMDKIISNLPSNAFKYNKEQGEVCVSLHTHDSQAVITISDTGIGIPLDKQRKLYTRFLDGDYRKKGTTGTGIGLSLTLDLVKLHHGEIDCQSQKGKGTTFTITIPLDKDKYLPEEIDDTQQPCIIDQQLIDRIKEEEEMAVDKKGNNQIPESLTATNKKATEDASEPYHVLLVEDNEQLLQTMAQTLRKRYHVLTAKNGRQALNTITKEPLDVVVSDVMMPEMDGIQLTHHVKQDPNYKQLPIILLTVLTSEEDRDKAYDSGADEYIMKPFRMDSLQRRIDNIILNRQRIKERFIAQTEFNIKEQHYSSPDELFIRKAIDNVRKHLDDPDYDRNRFATDMCGSGSTLYNKLRALTGQNIVGFISSIRLKEAYRILQKNPNTPINELATMVGFNTPKYFSKCFKKEFGFLPSDFNDQPMKSAPDDNDHHHK